MSSLLPSLSRLSLQSDTVPTAAGPNDPFLVAIVATLTNGSEDEKRNALMRLLSDVNGQYSRARAFVDANGMVPMVALLLTAPEGLKLRTAEVARELLGTGVYIRERFLNNGGAQAIVRGLRVPDNADPPPGWGLTLRPFLDITEQLMTLPHGRARLRSLDAVEAFASVVRTIGLLNADGMPYNINTRIAMCVIIGLVFDVEWDASVGLANLTDLDLYEHVSVLVVDGTRTPGGFTTTHRTMEALVALTSPRGGEKADAVQQALVDAGLLPALLYVLGEGHLEEALLSIMERKAFRALTNVTTRNPALQFVLAELRTVLGRLRTVGEEVFNGDQSTTPPVLGNDVSSFVTTSPLWFALLGGLVYIVDVLMTGSILARFDDNEKTRLVWMLSLCLPVVQWDRDFVMDTLNPHPLGDHPDYRELVPVLTAMLHDGSQDGRVRMAAKCLELLSSGPVVEAMITQTIVASMLAFLSDPPASEQEAVNSIMSCLNNMFEHDDNSTYWFKTQGGLSAIHKYFSSTNDRTVLSAIGVTMAVLVAVEQFYDFSEEAEDMEDDPQVDDAWVATVAPLVALLEPGRMLPSAAREQVVGCLSALIAPELPETHTPIGLYLSAIASLNAFLNAGGMERLVHVFRTDRYMITIKLLNEILGNHLFNGTERDRAIVAQAATRFAVAGGIAALVDAGVYDDAYADDDVYQRGMNDYLPQLQRLQRFILTKDFLPSWIKMLLDVTNAVKPPADGVRLMRLMGDDLPEERWGHINRLKLGVRSYGHIYDLLSQYRTMYRSQPDRYVDRVDGEIATAIKVFEWMDDPKVLIRAALNRVPTKQNGKDIHVQNYKPSLLAAELWVVHSLAEVLTTNVSIPPDPITDGSLTEAQTKQVAEYRDLLGSAQQLQIQYAWAVAHPGAPANFVETYRTELRINELLTMLVEKIENPFHVDGRQTVIHRDELAQLVDQGLVEDSGDSRKRARTTSAALRASVTMLYGAAKTDAAMTRLFPHLLRPATSCVM